MLARPGSPMPLATRRVRQGVSRKGRESRHALGVTVGFGSDPHAHEASESIRGLSARAPIFEDADARKVEVRGDAGVENEWL